MGRRAYQRPGVHKRKDVNRHYWFMRVWEPTRRADGSFGRKHSSKFLGYCDETPKKKAEAERDKICEGINRLTAPVSGEITMREFVEIWFAQHMTTLKPSTQAKYASHLRSNVLPKWGAFRLGDSDARRLQLWCNAELAEKAWNTRADIKALMSCVFETAIKWELHGAKNPARAVQLGQKNGQREKVLLTDEQVIALIEMVPDDVRLLLETCDLTGCRVSEVLGLQEKHVAPEHIEIRQSWVRGHLNPDTKTSEKGSRDWPLLHLAERYQALLTGDRNRFLFDRGDGQPYDDRDLLKMVRPLLVKLGLPAGTGFHSLRRGAITRWQERGASSIEAARMAGHARTTMTERYTIMRDERMKDLARRVN